MYILDQRILGIGMLLLQAALVIIKHRATGSIIKDKPEGNPWLWGVHVFNLFFLLLVNPIAALLLASGRLEMVDSTRLNLDDAWLRTVLEFGGVGVYAAGFALMGWALLSLGHRYQAGGSVPRTSDALIVTGPYRLIRHPMYAGAMAISLGLACMTQSLALSLVFLVYLALVQFLIPFEEERLEQAYGEPYRTYRKTVKKIIPFLY